MVKQFYVELEVPTIGPHTLELDKTTGALGHNAKQLCGL